MTSEIAAIIEQIKQKFVDLKNNYDNELSSNNQLRKDYSSLELVLEDKTKQNLSLANEISTLKSEIESLSDKLTKSISTNRNDVEIDLLVREIDHCIKQLKSN